MNSEKRLIYSFKNKTTDPILNISVDTCYQ